MEPDDPNDSPSTKQRPHMPPSHERIRPSMRFASSRPPAAAREPPVGSLMRALSHCAHPEEGTTVAVVVEPDGTRITIYWCGLCGALRAPSEGADTWIRPGLVLALESDDRWTALEASMRVFMSQLGELTTAAHEMCVRASDGLERSRAELQASVVSLDNAGAELARYAHAVLGELRE